MTTPRHPHGRSCSRQPSPASRKTVRMEGRRSPGLTRRTTDASLLSSTGSVGSVSGIRGARGTPSEDHAWGLAAETPVKGVARGGVEPPTFRFLVHAPFVAFCLLDLRLWVLPVLRPSLL